jgi:prevent-host-death family protein
MINVHEAKTRFSELLRRVEQGEEIVIARDGHPVARLVGMPTVVRTPGRWRGQIRIAPDFDDLPEEVLATFEGES